MSTFEEFFWWCFGVILGVLHIILLIRAMKTGVKNSVVSNRQIIVSISFTIIGLWMVVGLSSALEDAFSGVETGALHIGNINASKLPAQVYWIGITLMSGSLMIILTAGYRIKEEEKAAKKYKLAQKELWKREEQEIENKRQEKIDQEIENKRKRLTFAKSLVDKKQFKKAIEIFVSYEEGRKIIPEIKRRQAKYHEKLLEFDEAAEVYKEIGMDNDVIRVRKLKVEQGTVKVEQTVVHGDYIDDRDTIVKDSVINRSNIGAGGKSKAEEIKEVTEMKDKGIIDDDEFKQMKNEILGK